MLKICILATAVLTISGTLPPGYAEENPIETGGNWR